MKIPGQRLPPDERTGTHLQSIAASRGVGSVQTGWQVGVRVVDEHQPTRADRIALGLLVALVVAVLLLITLYGDYRQV